MINSPKSISQYCGWIGVRAARTSRESLGVRVSAFTLIELLIVVVIIAILAAIAVPNFLEAQVRSKVSRAQADLRTISLAVEVYRVDNNRYPPAELFDDFTARSIPLTTPIAYITTFPNDPLYRQVLGAFGGPNSKYAYVPGNIYFTSPVVNEQWRGKVYSLASRGPDGSLNFGGYCMARPEAIASGANLRGSYDATNGTVSSGDVIRLGR